MPLQPLRVLLIEDSANDAELVEAELLRVGYDADIQRVEVAEELALALSAGQWDVVISDSVLPHFSGENARRMVQAQLLDTPFIIISGKISEAVAAAFIKSGAHDYVAKDQIGRLGRVVQREIEAANTRQRLRENERHLASIAARLPGYIFRRVQSADGSSRFTYLSDSLFEQFGIEPASLIADPDRFWALVHPDDRATLAQTLDRAQQNRTPYRVEYRAVLPGERLVWLRAQAQPELQPNGDIIWNGLGIDVSAEKEAHERLNYLAYNDQLTGLPNRTLFLDRLSQALKESRRNDRGLAVHLIDLDDFKTVNDTLGHDAGDQLLARVARRLQEAIRASDTVARFGGDEFIALQTGIDESHAAELFAARLQAAVTTPFSVDGESLQIHASIGLVCHGLTANDHPYHSPAELIKLADQALYRAKGQGRNQYVINAADEQSA